VKMRFEKFLRLLVLMGILSLNLASAPPATTAAATPPPVEDIPADWWAQAQADIRASEYTITWQTDTTLADVPAAYHAANRAQNLRVYFTEEGIRVIPRTGDASWELGIQLTGRGSAELEVEERTITYRRDNYDYESLTNTEKGLVYDILFSSLDGVEFAFTGNLTARRDGSSVDFLTDSGVPVLRLKYSYVMVRDMLGDNTTVSMPDATHLRFTPNTSDPVTERLVMRLMALPAAADWNVESNQTDAQMGFAVASAGDVNSDGYSDVIVGAPTYGNGQVFVYYGSATGLSATASWMQTISQSGARFGAAVAGAGDVNGDGYADVIIGAPNYANGQAQEGAAFVYHGSVSGLGATAAWSAESDKAGAHFGAAVSGTGYAHSSLYTGVIVGAPEYNNGQANEGMAFIFYGSDSGLSVAPDWSAESDLATAGLGASVGCAGDVDGNGYADVIVGAPGYDNGETDEGRAFVYYGAAGSISATANWTVESNQAGALFGASVSLAGDVNGNGYGDVIVGAPGYANGHAAEGAAFLYLGASVGLTTTVGWSVEGGTADAQLGASVALAGDVDGDGYADVLIGAPGFSEGETGEGEVQLYSGAATGLSATAVWTQTLNQAGAHLGAAVSGAGDVNGDGYSDILVGAPGYSHPEVNEGGAFAFHGHVDSPNPTYDWTASRGQTTEQFGIVVGSAGDVNGDGYDDVIVGAPLYDGGQEDEGRALVYYGSPNGLPAAASWSYESDRTYARFGAAVSTAGDANGDGYDEVVIGAPNDTGSLSADGRAYVFFGQSNGLKTYYSWYIQGDQQFERLGLSVACAGDVNGDGYSDLIVGAPGHTNGQNFEGAAYIWLGTIDVREEGAIGFPSTAHWGVESNRGGASYGQAVSTAGDVNRDGYSDVLVGTKSYNNGASNEGAAFLFLGNAGAMSTAYVWYAEGGIAGAEYGATLDTAGDVNGDGYSDFIVGAPDYENGQNSEGAAFLYYGTPGTINPEPDLLLEINEAGALFGISVSTAGDVNGDGYADVIVGASDYYVLGKNGEAFIFYGAATGLNTTAHWVGDSAVASEEFGYAVSAAGDVNGDGFDDVIIGTNSSTAVYAFYGNGGGTPLRPRQMQLNGTTRLAPLGRVNSANSVRLHLEGLTPLGREWLKLEWQVAPLGQDFGAAGTVSGVDDAWRASGATLTQTVAGLQSSTAYHWRVRLLYRPGNPLAMSAGRWIHMPYNGWLETDFQTARGALSVSASNDSPTALGSATTLTATSGSTYVTYAWNFGDSASGSGKVVTHTYAATGEYTATVTASNGVSTVVASTHVMVVDEPIAGLTLVNDSPTAAGQATHFTATVTAGGGITYTWNFGDGSPVLIGDGDNTVTHIYSTPGPYVATVTARNFYGPVGATSSVTITDAPVTGLSVASNGPTIILGQPALLTATVTGGSAVSYVWDFGDATMGSGAMVAHPYAAIGTYAVVVTASNSLNALTATTSIMVVDQPITGLSAINDSPTALGQATTFTASVTGGTHISYTWEFADGDIGTGQTSTHVYAAVGIYTATVTVFNSNNTIHATTRVTVEPPITGLRAINDSPTPLGQPTTFTATLTDGANVNFLWNFGDGAVRSGDIVQHTYLATGFYTAIVTASNESSEMTATTRVTVTEVPLAGLAVVNDSPTPLGDPTTLTATLAAGSGTVYTWAFGDGATGSGATVQHVYPDMGTYTAIVTASNSLNSLTAATSVTITAGTPVSGLLAFNDSPTPLGNVTTLSATVESGSGVTYTWAFGDGAAFFPQDWPDSGKVVTHTYPAVGTYTATVTATNRAGQITAATTVVVEDAPIAGLTAYNNSPTPLGRTTTLSATVTAGSAISFTWDLGDGQSAVGALVTHVYAEARMYTATLTATNPINTVSAVTLVTIVSARYVYLPLVLRQSGGR